jgi:alpha-N-arabinofuranosidase
VVVGSMLISLLRHADRVAIGCLAQLVNVIAPIMTEPGGPAWRQTTFFPFAQASRYGRGRVLQVHADSPAYSTAVHGTAPILHATAVLDDESGALTIFAVNRSQSEPLALRVELRGLEAGAVLEHSVLTDADADAKNTLAEPERVTPQAVKGTEIVGGVLDATLPPLSWNVIRLGSVKSISGA